jgi:hypothetical protein
MATCDQPGVGQQRPHEIDPVPAMAAASLTGSSGAADNCAVVDQAACGETNATAAGIASTARGPLFAGAA